MEPRAPPKATHKYFIIRRLLFTCDKTHGNARSHWLPVATVDQPCRTRPHLRSTTSKANSSARSSSFALEASFVKFCALYNFERWLISRSESQQESGLARPMTGL